MSFTQDSLRFLRALARNNRRKWFQAHREDYESFVREPMRALVEAMDVRLARLAPEIVGDRRRSVFRIHRDIRFSKDKSPYKTHAACWFFHRDADSKVGRESQGGGAGFYFHFAPGASFVGGGLWMPPRPTLNRLRDAIAEDPEGFARIASDGRLKRRYGGLSDEAVLTRMPRGYRPDHPAAEWLRYQSFIMGRPLTDGQVTGARLPAILETECAMILPLVRWLNGALGLKPARRR